MFAVASLVHEFTCVILAYGCRHIEAHTSADTIVQDRRFVILEDYGCQAAVHNSLPALIIVWLPPLCISMIGTLFCRESICYCDHPLDLN